MDINKNIQVKWELHRWFQIQWGYIYIYLVHDDFFQLIFEKDDSDFSMGQYHGKKMSFFIMHHVVFFSVMFLGFFKSMTGPDIW